MAGYLCRWAVMPEGFGVGVGFVRWVSGHGVWRSSHAQRLTADGDEAATHSGGVPRVTPPIYV